MRAANLQIEAGECVAVVGPSGSGKSTLLNLISGFDHSTSGTVSVLGKGWNELTSRQRTSHRRRSLGFIQQSFNLVAFLSAEENVLLPLLLDGQSRRAATPTVREAFDRFGLQSVIHRFPDQLSGGQQQRVAILRAMTAGHAILLADEPTGALDTENSVAIFHAIQEYSKAPGRAALIVSHDPRVSDVATPHGSACRRCLWLAGGGSSGWSHVGWLVGNSVSLSL